MLFLNLFQWCGLPFEVKKNFLLSTHISNVTKRFSKDTAYVLIYRKLDPHPKAPSMSLDPVLRPELRDFVIKDNETFLKVSIPSFTGS